jgi:hypothetical protein
VNDSTRHRLFNGKRRIAHRLRKIAWSAQARPMLAASNIQYEVADKARGLACGGIGAMHLLARRTGLVGAIDRNLQLLKVHLPYHESDHVLNSAYNILAGGTCLEDIEQQRTNEVYLDGLAAKSIPDPTTAGDFCRRFKVPHIETLMEAINEVRLGVWQRQPQRFFRQAIIDADGTLATTYGQCKQGMDSSFKGQWGYPPLVISLANTGEPLYLVNRSGNRPSHEGAGGWLDRAVGLCRRAGFKRILLRGDTDFTQTEKLDGWDDAKVGFILGMDAMPNLVAMADGLPATAWKRLVRGPKDEVKTQPRARPENVKERIVRQREFENIRLQGEDVAEVGYQPTKCRKIYRLVVVRKNLTVEKGERALFDDVRYFFYISNQNDLWPDGLVGRATGRCNQENLLEQLKNGARAMAMPVGDLVSNWAYMVMASLAWTRKAWLALGLPQRGRWAQTHQAQKESLLKMEFKKFLNVMMRLPCQVVRTGRRIVYRLLSWNPWQEVLLRGVEALRPCGWLGPQSAVVAARRVPLRC